MNFEVENVNINKTTISTRFKNCSVTSTIGQCEENDNESEYTDFDFYPKIEPSRFNGNCDIALQFRRVCSACRHAKCLAIGMSRDLIRKEDLNERSLCSTIKIKQKQNIIEQTRMSSFPIYLLDLLNNDRSDLTTPSISNEVARQSKLSLKIRVKLAQDFMPNWLLSFYTLLQSFIKCTNEFRMFTIDEQKNRFFNEIFMVLLL
ncbi:unnamed protein product [Rotaria magnacalcarata]